MPVTLREIRAAACLFGGLLAALPMRAGVDLDIPVFAGGFGNDFYIRAAGAFETAHPGVRVHVYGDPRIHDQIRVRVIDGHYPDAACAAYVLWPSLIRARKVLDLTPFLGEKNWEGDATWGSTFLPGALDNWRVDGRVYGLPVSFSCWMIFYNEGLFRRHGWKPAKTWDEFYLLCEKIRAAGIAPLSLPGTRWLYADAFFRAAFYNLAGASGWDDMNALKPGTRADEHYVRAAAVEQRVTTRYTLSGWEGENHTGAELSFLQERAAMTVSGSWLTNEMAGKIPAGFELGTMNFPVFSDGRADPSSIQVSSDSFFVFDTGNPERERATLDFLRFLTSREQAAAFVRAFDSPSALRGMPLSAYTPRMRPTAALIAAAREAFPMRQVMLQPDAVRQALVDESSRLTLGRITPAEFGRRLEAAAAEDRAQAADPNRIRIRHPVAGAVLLGVIAALAVWLAGGAWRTARPARAGSGADFGVLRPGMGAVFVGPALLLYTAFALAPALTALAWSMTRWDGIGAREWVGWFNFKSLLFGNDLFWQALSHNFFLMTVPIVAVVPLALVAAALLHRGVWGGAAFRAIFLFPNLLGGIAATLIWLNAYRPHGGLVNTGLSAAGRWLHSARLAGFDGYPWLSVDHLYVALIPIYLWMACGFNLILYLAAMEGIDPQLYEAASLDGASALRQFFGITLPLIREVLIVSAVFLVIAGLNAFEMIWLLTEQDPSAQVHTLGTLLVSTMFKDFAIGRATALAVILFVLVFAASAALMRLLRREPIEA